MIEIGEAPSNLRHLFYADSRYLNEQLVAEIYNRHPDDTFWALRAYQALVVEIRTSYASLIFHEILYPVGMNG